MLQVLRACTCYERRLPILYWHQPRGSVRRTHDCVDSPAFLAFQQLVFEHRADDAFEVVRIATWAAVFVCGDHADNRIIGGGVQFRTNRANRF